MAAADSRVAVIGIGAMGGPMSRRLVAAGHSVATYDIDPVRAQVTGAAAHASIADALAGAQAVISLVRTLPQTEEVAAAVEMAAAPGTAFLVMSTITPTAMLRIAQRLTSRGLDVLDAPVSGGTAGAAAGSLAIMVGGPTSVLERVRPLLGALGSNIFHAGERWGDGQALKLANQLMLCVNMLGTLEGLKLARSYGLTPEQVLPVIGVSTGMSWVSENWEAVHSWWEGHPSGGALDIIHKDLRSLLGDAAERQESYPVAALAFNLLREVL